ncbi:MAG: alpha-amylase family glycosyl hydrolase [Thermoleophilia bacterium]|nr:alpha-amylase family glycosyl hydrolase [Thermoleophilia bacterium]
MTELRATYRLQLGPQLDFRAAHELVPYLRELGVSHLYLSPVLQAGADSTHGYDVTDPTRVSSELGGEDALRALCTAGLGVVVDLVPNHMAAVAESPLWRDEELRARFFDLDAATGRHRRFFDVDGLAGVRQEDPEVFEATHRLMLDLVRDGLVDGVRIDHVDGLADPRGYLERLQASGVRHVWVEKILAHGEELRDWPVHGTTGYGFANDLTALFVDPAAEAPLTALYEEVTGELRSFAEIADEAKREQAETTFAPEVERLHRICAVDGIAAALASLPVYRTYVEPWSGRVEAADRDALRDVAPDLRERLLLERPAPPELVTRFQQTTGAVMAKGVEDTALYRYSRLLCLNEVGGDPGRFSLPLERFHELAARRAERFPHELLATTTHDTKRSGDVRARLAALSWVPDEWAALVRDLRVRGEDAYLALQTVVGAWPIDAERLDAYLEKALREGKRTSSWRRPDEAAERRLKALARRLLADPRVTALAERLRPLGERISLAMTLLKATAPGVPDVYQGDELTLLALVDPDNRRPVDWKRARTALAGPPSKLAVLRAALALRARRPDAFAGPYEPVDLGPGVCAYTRDGTVLVVVPIRPGTVLPDAPSGWHDLIDPALGVRLLERVA